MKLKGALAAFATLLCSVLLCVGALELIFRTVLTDDKLRAKDWNDRPKFYYVPESAPTLQDRAHTEEKPEHTFRIAVVGDSFAFAPYMQFDDTFAKKLERMLNLNDTSERVEVINYGVPRYSTSHEVGVVKKALAEKADLVLLQITLNDPEIKPYHPTGLIGSAVDRFGGIEFNSGLLAHWKTAAFIVKRFYNYQSQGKYISYFFDLWEKKNTKDNFMNSFDEIYKLTQNAKVPLVAVLFPLVGLPMDDSYPFQKLHDTVGKICSDYKIPELDLLNSYRGIPPERIQVIVRKDFHPNELGHRIAAEEIYTFLAAHKLLPEFAIIRTTVPERIGIKLEGESKR